MATGTAIAAGVAALASVAQVAIGAKQTKDAREEIEDFEVEASYNPYEALMYSTKGGQLQMEQANKNLATAADSISQTGSRGVGNINAAVGDANKVTEQVAADFDAKEKERQAKIAKGDWDVMQVEKQEDYMQLSGYANLMNYGQSMVNNGMGSLAGSAALISASAYATTPASTPTTTTTTPSVIATTANRSGSGGSNAFYNPYAQDANVAIELAGSEDKPYF